MSASSRNKPLIITFDAFGTLFTPREPIAKSYAYHARRHGLSGFTDDQVSSAFRHAFRKESERAPNYGKAMGMQAPQWWSKVIHSTFRPFTQSPALPEQLVRTLLKLYSSSKGYRLYADVVPFFRLLREMKEAAREDSSAKRISVGIVTNSDDRVTTILSSLGLLCRSSRHGVVAYKEKSDVQYCQESKDFADIDFITLSYDVGFEKPSQEIFDAAKNLANSGCADANQGKYIHVGDDLGKDFHGAELAGWQGILLDREQQHAAKSPTSTIASLLDLEPYIQN